MATMIDPKTNLLAASYVCKYVKSGEDEAPPCISQNSNSSDPSKTSNPSESSVTTTAATAATTATAPVATNANDNIYSNGKVVVSKQVRFLLLIRILFKLFSDDERRQARKRSRQPQQQQQPPQQEGPQAESLKVQVSKVIKHCIEENRKGLPEYSPLGKVIQHRLQHVPNIERYWNRAEHDLILYLAGCRTGKQQLLQLQQQQQQQQQLQQQQQQQQQQKAKDKISVVGV